MKNKIVLSLFSAIIVAGCGTNTTQADLGLEQSVNQFQASSVQASFAQNAESDEILIDEDYYKNFPDKQLSNSISQVEAGIIPTEIETSPVNQYQSQSFLSIFNKKALIDIYDSYGSPEKFVVTGRLYKKKSINPDKTSDSKWTNLFRAIKYFTPDPISNTDVNIIANGLSRIAKTDSKGYFKAEFTNTNFKPGVNSLSAKLLTTKYKYDVPQEEVVIDNQKSDKIGIISDIDDTVKYTGADQILKMAKNILLGNYKTDKAIPGVASLYRGILNSPQSTGFDCVNYVTGSPASLYARIENFLKLNNFPEGSLEMKKSGSTIDPAPSDTLNYKIARIRPIIKAYPDKKFLCFGDTTQADTQVYLKIKQEFPNNIIGIYINNATKANPTDPKYKGVMVTESAIDAAQDLFKKGIISQESLDKVISDIK